ncbi:hypothetical protein FO454_11210 [Staphylococcus lugdunensis]|uniref:Uncharacterized protein n=1 Tax=Staphylococcus lugdunensis TaxID=28035 RepID=A0ABX6BWQ9_STALU|nr:hypothetical protein B7454_10740 [Staphylococcus lugdunensis]QEX31841.1 hypothetical protein FO457_09255 [Staphylococcus lugdunensis]QEX36045.1 hypothetical protein FO455_06060 [Staphylococcus lugdunensis]QEX39440.1 hypothetical protein FO454_11210 [Staphylococcus lugdunensis]
MGAGQHSLSIRSPASPRLTGTEKAWYKRIFNPVNYCQYIVHSLKRYDVSDASPLALYFNVKGEILYKRTKLS